MTEGRGPARLAAVMLIGGTALALTGAAIPFTTVVGGEGYTGSTSEHLEAVARSPCLWRLANVFWIAGTAIGIAGMAWATARLERGANLVGLRAGMALYALGAAAWLAVSFIRMTATVWAVEQNVPLSDYLVYARMQGAGNDTFIIMSSIGIAVIGAALRPVTSWLGASLLGVGAVVALLGISQIAIPAMAYIGPAIAGVAMLRTEDE